VADIYVPGVRSRFDTNKLIEDLMQVERIPRNRVEENVTALESQKTYWQDLGRRMSSVRESARALFSFQNPFSERLAVSDNPSVLTASANSESSETEHFFTVKQIAEADRFMSLPLASDYKVAAGDYRLTAGSSEVSFTFRGGSVTEFTDMLNRRGTGKIQGRIVNVDKTSKALLIESVQTGADFRLGFGGNALTLALDLGILVKDENAVPSRPKPAAPVQPPSAPPPVAKAEPAPPSAPPPPPPEPVTIYIKPVGNATNSVIEQGGASTASPMSTLDIPFNNNGNGGIPATRSMMLKYESEITAPLTGRHVINSLMLDEEETATRNAQNLDVLSLVFDDGSTAALPAISDGQGYNARQYALASIAGDKTISSLRINNTNTSREVSLRNIQLFDPTPAAPETAQAENDSVATPEENPLDTENALAAAPPATETASETAETGNELAENDIDGAETLDDISPNPGYRPRLAVSTARDAVIAMDGIEVTRPANTIDDLLPGVTLTARSSAEQPVRIGIEPDRESVKDSVIALVGNYNRLMAELNVVSRSDPAVIDELTYLDDTEREDLRKKLGTFSGDSGISQMRATLQNIFTSPYRLNDGRSILLSEFGVGTDVQRQGGYDRSRLRGYMQIDEKTLDGAISARLTDLQSIFGLDTDSDLIIDSGLAFSLDRLIRPYVETGGLIALKTGTLDRSIDSSRQRMESIDRQLASKEQTLRSQYGQMESAFSQMERMSSALENFGTSNNNR
jgi:flagellar hook-associated protein 2